MTMSDPYYGKVDSGRSLVLLIPVLLFLALHLCVKGIAIVAIHSAGGPPGAMCGAVVSLFMPLAVYAMVIGGCWLIGVSPKTPAYVALCITVLALLLPRGSRPGAVHGETLSRLPGMAALTQCQKELFQDLDRQFIKDHRCSENEQELARYAGLARAAKIDDKEAVAVYRAVVVVMNELGGQLDQQKKALDHFQSFYAGGSSASIFVFTDLDQLNARIESAEKLRSVYREMLEYRKRLPDRLRTVLIAKGAEQSRAPELAIKIRDKHFPAGALQGVLILDSQRVDLVVRRLTLLRDNWGKWTRDSATGDVVAQDPQIQAQAGDLLKRIREIEGQLDGLAGKILAGQPHR
jgi:hypothetical protein